MVEVFKTNVTRKTQSKALLCALAQAFPMSKINLDLSDCDKVLRVEAERIEAQELILVVKKHGFTCEILD